NLSQGGTLFRAPFAKQLTKTSTPTSSYRKALDMFRKGKETKKAPPASTSAAIAIHQHYELQIQMCQERMVMQREEHAKKMLLLDLQIEEIKKRLDA
ncbi:hypothetical protein JTE90_013440, partial [Oedothorax gibbosus]